MKVFYICFAYFHSVLDIILRVADIAISIKSLHTLLMLIHTDIKHIHTESKHTRTQQSRGDDDHDDATSARGSSRYSFSAFA